MKPPAAGYFVCSGHGARVAARLMVLRCAAPASIPAPAAHRCAAAGIDPDAATERLAWTPLTPQSVAWMAQPCRPRRSCRAWDLLRLAAAGGEFRHPFDLHVAVLQLPLVILFQQHRADQPHDSS